MPAIDLSPSPSSGVTPILTCGSLWFTQMRRDNCNFVHPLRARPTMKPLDEYKEKELMIVHSMRSGFHSEDRWFALLMSRLFFRMIAE